tara:strand:- start:141 stop:404 length:264 start_codon:yes stop_codon:yes gene_type:complete
VAEKIDVAGLVERLRDKPDETYDDREEAADTITALQAENERLREAGGRLMEWWPAGSENGLAAKSKGDGFSADLCAFRAALEPSEVK